jgi:hypothetical protein
MAVVKFVAAGTRVGKAAGGAVGLAGAVSERLGRAGESPGNAGGTGSVTPVGEARKPFWRSHLGRRNGPRLTAGADASPAGPAASGFQGSGAPGWLIGSRPL